MFSGMNRLEAEIGLHLPVTARRAVDPGLEELHPRPLPEVLEESIDGRPRAEELAVGGANLGERALDGGSRAQLLDLEAVLRGQRPDLAVDGSLRLRRQEETLPQAVDALPELRQPSSGATRLAGLPVQVLELVLPDLGALQAGPQERYVAGSDEATEDEEAGYQSAPLIPSDLHHPQYRRSLRGRK